MNTGLKLFARNGYHATSVSDIINDIGVARGTFYRYFDDKSDLFNQILSDNFGYAMRALPNFPYDRPMTLEEMEGTLKKAFHEFLSPPGAREFVRMVVNETSGSNESFAKLYEAFLEFLAQGFTSYIIRMQEVGEIKECDPKVSAYLVLAVIKETFIQWAIGDKFDDLEELIREMASFLRNGLSDHVDDEAPKD